jgi:hypothetical protein
LNVFSVETAVKTAVSGTLILGCEFSVGKSNRFYAAKLHHQCVLNTH